ncbi:Leucyl-tRNA synthetase, mitochondrial [Polyrhizophydium stewartii]|uniref:leucine--tRNA ligase n=1 Tax=Polyrhizophydium stewartii TaxID=2732419 RepID=A0ABR4MVK6_9FUNG
MFPCPSGSLHMGHARVVHPIGWDAFGLPAENAAIERGLAPAAWTQSNIAHMRTQLAALGAAFDWHRELSTSDPAYFRWTQHLFLRLWRAGLVERREALVNWDPVDGTVLANEQVSPDGRAERSGARVELRRLAQWFFKITHYAEDLVGDLDALDWPDSVKQQQLNWIGLQHGVALDLAVAPHGEPAAVPARLEVFVPDAATSTERHGLCIAVGPEHPILTSLSASRAARVAEWLQHAMRTTSHAAHDAAGMPPGVWTGLVARHPLDSSARLPVVVTADMLREPSACRLVAAVAGDSSDGVMDAAKALAHGIAGADSELAVWIAENAGSDGLAASVRINTDAWLDGGVACRASSHRLRDWLVSRQRSWGTPIPIPVPVPDDQLPVTHTWTASSTHKAALGDSDAAACACPKCNGVARHEADTMDTFVDSSWYWLRYLDPHNTSAMASPTCSAQLPVDVYIGGIEHAIMHLLYARFIAKFLAADGVVALERVVLGTAYRCPDSGKYLASTDVDTSGEPRVVATGKRAIVSIEKMSKSKHNGVDPMPVFERHGVDATRLYLLYRAAPQDELVWDSAAIVGMERFLARVRTLVDGVCAAGSGGSIASSSPAESGTASSATLAKAMADAREQVTAAMAHFGFPVAVASLIKLSHAAAECPPHHAQTRRAVDLLLRLLHPFAPVVTLELAGRLAGAPVTTEQLAWPSAADAAFEAAVQICVLQINGKKAAVVEDVPAVIAHDHAAIQAHVLASPAVAQLLADPATGAQREPRRIVVAKTGKLVNMVVMVGRILLRPRGAWGARAC